jgi:hypothetical protein
LATPHKKKRNELSTRRKDVPQAGAASNVITLDSDGPGANSTESTSSRKRKVSFAPEVSHGNDSTSKSKKRKSDSGEGAGFNADSTTFTRFGDDGLVVNSETPNRDFPADPRVASPTNQIVGEVNPTASKKRPKDGVHKATPSSRDSSEKNGTKKSKTKGQNSIMSKATHSDASVAAVGTGDAAASPPSLSFAEELAGALTQSGGMSTSTGQLS